MIAVDLTPNLFEVQPEWAGSPYMIQNRSVNMRSKCTNSTLSVRRAVPFFCRTGAEQ